MVLLQQKLSSLRADVVKLSSHIVYPVLLPTNVPNAWIRPGFQLVPASPQQVFNGTKVVLADIQVFVELGPGT